MYALPKYILASNKFVRFDEQKCIFARQIYALFFYYVKKHQIDFCIKYIFASNTFLQGIKSISASHLMCWTFSFGKCTQKYIFAYILLCQMLQIHFCKAPDTFLLVKCYKSIFASNVMFFAKQKTQYFRIRLYVHIYFSFCLLCFLRCFLFWLLVEHFPKKNV